MQVIEIYIQWKHEQHPGSIMSIKAIKYLLLVW